MATDPSLKPQPRSRIVTGLEPTDPRERMFSALIWARSNDISVVADAEPRVVCTSTAKPVWELAPGAKAVSPLGACILKYQPYTSDLEAACVVAIGQTRRWVEGFDVGINGFKAPTNWHTSVARNLLLHGYMLGLEIRNLAVSTVCKRHGDVRYSTISGGCWKCKVEEDADRPGTAGALPANVVDDDKTPYDPNAGRH